MRKSKRSRAQAAKDHQDIAEQYLAGRTQRDIVEWIKANRRYTLSLGQINADIQKISAGWRAKAEISIAELRAVDLARLDHIERRACEGFARSLQDRVTTRKGDGKTVTIKETRDGDPRWLMIRLQCIRERKEILGYAKPERLELGGQVEAPRELGAAMREALEIAYGETRVQSVHWAIAMKPPAQ